MRILREVLAAVLIAGILAFPVWAQVLPGTPFTGAGGNVIGWPILAPDGTSGAPSYSFAACPTCGMYETASDVNIRAGSGAILTLQTAAAGAGATLGFATATGAAQAINISGANSTGGSSPGGGINLSGGTGGTSNGVGGGVSLLGGIGRGTQNGGDIGVQGGAFTGTGVDGRFLVANNTWAQFAMQRSMVAANYTNATASFTSTGLKPFGNVVSGRKYSFTVSIFFSDSTAADGAQFDFNGGSATATNFIAHCTAANSAGAALVITNAASAALATAVQVALALTTQSWLQCAGTFEPSSTGTFIVRAAQTAHSTGTLTVSRGSFLTVEDMP